MELLVTEHRQNIPSRFNNNIVRIFIDRDYYYGYWVSEELVYSVLDDEQKKQYISDPSYAGGQFDVTPEIAQKLIDAGHTPYTKIKVL